MPLASEAADQEIVNGNVTEAESAGLSGRGADGAASAGAIPTTSANPERTSNAGSRALNARPPLRPERSSLAGRPAETSLHIGSDHGVRVEREGAGLRLVAAARACTRPDHVAIVGGAQRDRRSHGEWRGSAAADRHVDPCWSGGDA